MSENTIIKAKITAAGHDITKQTTSFEIRATAAELDGQGYDHDEVRNDKGIKTRTCSFTHRQPKNTTSVLENLMEGESDSRVMVSISSGGTPANRRPVQLNIEDNYPIFTHHLIDDPDRGNVIFGFVSQAGPSYEIGQYVNRAITVSQPRHYRAPQVLESTDFSTSGRRLVPVSIPIRTSTRLGSLNTLSRTQALVFAIDIQPVTYIIRTIPSDGSSTSLYAQTIHASGRYNAAFRFPNRTSSITYSVAFLPTADGDYSGSIYVYRIDL